MHVNFRRNSAGFSIIELLVAMAIGLITVVVIGQVMAVSEGQKRTTTGGTDAMVNAALALYTIERDIKSAGYGMIPMMASLGCELRASYAGSAINETAAPLPANEDYGLSASASDKWKWGAPTKVPFVLAPVRITDGASGAPDSIRVLAASKAGAMLPSTLMADHDSSDADVFFVDSDVGVQAGDIMVAVPQAPSASAWCTLFQASSLDTNKVYHATSGGSKWNLSPGSTNMPDYSAGDFLINLGRILDHAYTVVENNLRMAEFNSNATGADGLWHPVDASGNTVKDAAGKALPPADLYPQIVQMQAVYGKDTNADCKVDAWEVTQPTTGAQWQQVRAVRLALVARSQLIEKENVTLAEADVAAGQKCNTASPNSGLVCWRPNPGDATSGTEIKLDTVVGADWKRYRYRVYDTTVPVRNAIWLQKTTNTACDI